MPSIGQITEYYNEYLPKLSNPTGRHKVIFQTLVTLNLSGKSVLDIGCGTGITTKFLSTKAKSVVGVDISPVLIEHARKYNSSKNIQYFCENVNEFKTRDRFDLIVLIDVMEHIKRLDIPDLFDKLYGLAGEDTQIYLNIPIGDVIVYLKATFPDSLQIVDEPYSVQDVLETFKTIDFVPYYLRMYWGQYVEYLFWKTYNQQKHFDRSFKTLKRSNANG